MTDTETPPEPPLDARRLLALVGGVTLVGSYVLPWAAVVSPDATTAPAGTLGGGQIGLSPLLLVGLGVLVIVLAGLRWSLSTQVAVGLVGLVATVVAILTRAWLASEANALQVGPYEGAATAFDPAMATLVALAGGFLAVAGGFGAAVDAVLSRRRGT